MGVNPSLGEFGLVGTADVDVGLPGLSGQENIPLDTFLPMKTTAARPNDTGNSLHHQ